MRVSRISAGIIIVFFATASFAQGPWAKKDWKKWSKDDCKKVLENSPWAQQWTYEDAKMANFSSRPEGTTAGGVGSGSTQGVGSESELQVAYTIQLRSALPVREAVVRQLMLANRFDNMNQEQQESFLKQTEPYLNRKYDDVIVVHVTYSSNVVEYNRGLMTFWENYPGGTVPQDAFLNTPRGEKVPVAQLIAPKGGAQEFEFIFPRVFNGKPVLEPGDKKMSVEFMSPKVGQVASSRVFVEFKVEGMMENGSLVY